MLAVTLNCGKRTEFQMRKEMMKKTLEEKKTHFKKLKSLPSAWLEPYCSGTPVPK